MTRIEGEGPLVLLILDGVGLGRGDAFDAVTVARTPNLDRLGKEYLATQIHAHGQWVGLPSNNDMGNSEVGHNIMGASRIFDQGAKRVDEAIASGALWADAWRDLVAYCDARGGALHLIGLLSDGNVHASMDHLAALLDQAVVEGLPKLRVHVLLDGRDVPDRTALNYVDALEAKLALISGDPRKDYRIASGGGRMVTTMDRYGADWSIVERGWRAHALGEARPFFSTSEAITCFRVEQPGISDQLLPPFVIVDSNSEPVGRVENGDAVVLFNFRGDRAMELAQTFTNEAFDHFDRVRRPDVYFAGMTLYDGDSNTPPNRLIQPPVMPGTVSEHIAAFGLRQLAVAETQKFGHVTYFWNGNRTEKFDADREVYLEIPSDRVPFDQRPWMKSAQTADSIIDAVISEDHDFIRANFPGGDMVGHTGNFEASIVAIEAIDIAIGRIAAAVAARRGCLIVTADHGNAEDMVERDKQGKPQFVDDGTPRWRTAHSTNSVPLLVANYGGGTLALAEDLTTAGLANLGATLLTILQVPVPSYYAPSLLRWT